MPRREHDEADLAYMRSLASAVVQRSPRHLITVLLVMALAIAAGIAWMGYARIDVVVRGSGRVVPSQQLQVIQSLEGGVVSEFLVAEGDLVEPGQPLVKLSDIAFASSFEENRLLYLELMARIARLQAEADGGEFQSDEELVREAPELVARAERLYESRQRQLEESQQILQERMRQQKSELAEARAKRRKLGKSLAFVREELELKSPLVKRGLVSKVEYLQLQKQENETAGEFEEVRLSIPRIESTIEEARRKVEQDRLDFANEAREELNEARAEAARIAESQEALEDRVQRTTVRAPVKGTITRLHLNTVGGVVPPGGPIMEIVPYEDSLLVQVQIKPQDVANISLGLPARLKFSAYDFAVHGTLDGEVDFLSADTVTEEEGESFYVARIKPARTFFGRSAQPLPIRVGMTAEADIITDKKTILEYLLKPINRGLQRALREG